MTVQSNSTAIMEAEGVCVCPLPLMDWGRLWGICGYCVIGIRIRILLLWWSFSVLEWFDGKYGCLDSFRRGGGASTFLHVLSLFCSALVFKRSWVSSDETSLQNKRYTITFHASYHKKEVYHLVGLFGFWRHHLPSFGAQQWPVIGTEASR